MLRSSKTRYKRLETCIFHLSLAAAALLAPASPTRAQSPHPAQSYSIGTWSTAQGLTSYSVLDILQTREGYLWLASYEGLIRFDGVTFRSYTEADIPGLDRRSIWALATDTSGTLWAGSESGGLIRYKNGSFELFTKKKSALNSDAITALMMDHDGALWIGTRAGVNRYVGGRMESVPLPTSITTPTVTAFAQDSDGSVWIGTVSNGVVRYTNGKFARFTTANGLHDDHVTALYHAADGTLWIGDYGVGVTRMRGGVLTRIAATGDGVPRRVNRILGDAGGTVWLAADNGLFKVDGDKAIPVTQISGAPFSESQALYYDAEGSLWVGARQGGLSRLREATFANLSTANGLPNNLVHSISGDAAGGVWIATQGGAVHRTANGKIVAYTTRNHMLRDDIVRDVQQDRTGDVWFATNGGLTRLHDGHTITYTEKDGLADRRVRVLFQDRAGGIWAGAKDGLSYYSNGKFRNFGAADGLPDTYILSLLEDHSGTLWVGTQSHGLFKKVGERFVQASPELVGQPIFRMDEDSAHVLWIGTTTGLVRMQGARIARFTQRDGLPATTIFQTLEDNTGGLWLTGKWGVARVPKSELEQAAGGRRLSSVKLFGTYDGLAVSEVTGVSEAYRAPDGTLWFPTPGGAARVDPAHLRKNERAPGVLVEQVVVDDDARPATTSSMKLAPGVRKLEFDYTALSFVAPQQVRFRYRLDGFDDTWVDGGTRRVAYYTNLPPGKYDFHVQASNEDGVWNSAGASLPLVLEPHFWQTDWFFVLMVLALLAIGGIAYTIRIATVRRAVERREREESRQRVTQILESITDAFVALDKAWKFTYVNHTAEGLLGMTRSKLIGRSCWEVFPDALDSDIEPELRRVAAERMTMRCEARLATGTRPWVEIHGYPAADGVALYFADITLRKEAEEALRSQSLHDDLTGLYNRRGLLALAEQQVRSAERTKRGFDVVFIDLDGLKQINDTFGHPVGDQALMDTGDMLRHTFRESDVLSRLGGDEFAVLVLDEKGGGVELAGKRLQDLIEEHNTNSGRPYRLAVSMGHCRFDPANPKPVWELLNAADRVMYGDKRDKRVIR